MIYIRVMQLKKVRMLKKHLVGNTVNHHYTDTRYNDKIRYFVIMTIWMSRNFRLRGDSQWEIMQEYCINSSSNTCFWYKLESYHWEIKIKQSLSYISFCQQEIHCNDNISGNKCSRCITKTYLYNFDPLKPHFYIVKLGFTGVYIIFLIYAQNIDCGYSLEPPRRGGSNECPQSMFCAEVWKISEFFIWKFSVFVDKMFCIFE